MRSSHPVWLLAVALMLALLVVTRGQDEEAPLAPPQPTWEYRVLAWEPSDTNDVLRQVTGTDLGQLDDLVRSLAREGSPLNNSRLLTAVRERLAAKLNAVGREGWEAFWVGEDRVVVGGELLPAPTVLLRRRL